MSRLLRFEGTDEEYISLLESKVKDLSAQLVSFKQHIDIINKALRESCPPASNPVSLELKAVKRRRIDIINKASKKSCLPASNLVPLQLRAVKRRRINIINEALRESCPPASNLVPLQPRDVERERIDIIDEAPEESCPPASNSKPQLSPLRWTKEADSLINATPKAEDWKMPWIIDGCLSLRDLILGNSLPNSSPDDVEISFNDTELSRTARFARCIRLYRNTAKLWGKVRRFQEIVLASACLVLLDSGKPTEHVDTIMQIHITDGSLKHLLSLRCGAKFANDLVNELHWRGWVDKAQEILFLWGKPLAQYGRFADRRNNTFGYIVKGLCAFEHTGETPKNAADDLFVPSLVQSVVGTSIKLDRILEVLGYTNTAPSPSANSQDDLPSMMNSAQTTRAAYCGPNTQSHENERPGERDTTSIGNQSPRLNLLFNDMTNPFYYDWGGPNNLYQPNNVANPFFTNWEDPNGLASAERILAPQSISGW